MESHSKHASHKTHSEDRTTNRRSARQSASMLRPQLLEKQYLDQNHKCARLPIQMNYAFKAKYTSPIRKDFVRYVASQYDLSKFNEDILLEEYGQHARLKYTPSNDL